jgi:hypothetical protein
VWPLPAGRGTFVRGLGWFSDRGRRYYHEGVDYSAPIGTPVYAAHAGRVSWAAHERTAGAAAAHAIGGGNVVNIDGAGFLTQYAHLASIAVRQGSSVRAGQQIGQVGNTGDATGAHLHFGLRLAIVGWVDPRLFFQPPTSTMSGKLSYEQVAQLAKQVGLTGETAAVAVAIAYAESGHRADALGDRNNPSPGCRSFGLWQINWCPNRDGTGSIRDEVRRTHPDPLVNAKAMAAISSGGRNWQPWTTYTRNRYQAYLPRARQAVSGGPAAADTRPLTKPLNANGQCEPGYVRRYGTLTCYRQDALGGAEFDPTKVVPDVAGALANLNTAIADIPAQLGDAGRQLVILGGIIALIYLGLRRGLAPGGT